MAVRKSPAWRAGLAKFPPNCHVEPSANRFAASSPGHRPMDSSPLPTVEWLVTRELVPYEEACKLMAERVDAIAAGRARELVWLLEHPPLYTAGTSAKASDL